MSHLTIVDDLEDNLMLYEDLLSSVYELELIRDPITLVDFLKNNHTDLLLLDLHMPRINGFELYEQVKQNHPSIPTIFLSSDPSEEALVKGLDMGADDFIVKPVSLKELVARINNKLNHKKEETVEQKTIKIGDFTLYCDLQSAEIEGKKIQLTPIEFKLINLFSRNPNKIFSRDYISKLLWPDIHVQNQNIDTHLSNLRKKLSPFSNNIKTIKSRGYILRL